METNQTNPAEHLAKSIEGIRGLMAYMKEQANNPALSESQRDILKKKMEEAGFDKAEQQLNDSVEKLKNATNVNPQTKQ